MSNTDFTQTLLAQFEDISAMVRQHETFVDVSDKPKLDKVPMMLKVKSDRALKYAIELIAEIKFGVSVFRYHIGNGIPHYLRKIK